MRASPGSGVLKVGERGIKLFKNRRFSFDRRIATAQFLMSHP